MKEIIRGGCEPMVQQKSDEDDKMIQLMKMLGEGTVSKQAVHTKAARGVRNTYNDPVPYESTDTKVEKLTKRIEKLEKLLEILVNKEEIAKLKKLLEIE